MSKVYISEQVIAFMHRQAPEPRRSLKAALVDLEKGKGDLIALEENLAGFWRLRVGRFRIVVRYEEDRIDCVFAEERRLVYELFAAMLREKL